MMREKILLISQLFPPGKSSSGFNLLKRIKEAGFDFDVITAPGNDAFTENVAMFRDAASSFNIMRVKLSPALANPDEIRAAFISKAVDLAGELLKANHYRALLSHSNEFASHLAAYEIKSLRPDLRWLASYGDPFGGNPYSTYYGQNFPEDLLAREKELVQLYDDIIVTNERQKELMLSYFGQPDLERKFHILPHCFDPAFFRERLYRNDKFIFSHIGMLYKYKRSSLPFIEAIKYLLANWPEYKDKFVLNFVGASDVHIREYLEEGGGHHVAAFPAVTYAESTEMMMDADALLLRDADFSEDTLAYSPFFPGKLVDYLGAEKPIIAVTMKNGFVADFAREHDGVFVAAEDEIEEIALHMKDLIDGKVKAPSSIPYLSTHASGHNFRELIAADSRPKTLLVAGHKLNFIEPFISYLTDNSNYNILIDQWDGHANHDERESAAKLEQADIIFCEWGLGNALWYSQHKKAGQKLITRVHSQEFRTQFFDEINWDNVDNIITVSPWFYHEFITRYRNLIEKTKMIFNLIDCASFKQGSFRNKKSLGFIGCVPAMKRLDLAVDLFVSLWKKDPSYTLHIKGKKPDEYSWIKSDKKENDYYNSLFQKIAFLPCSKNIIFEPFGDDMPEFLSRMDYILSTSDFESFHMVLAEGMSAGCMPVIRNWPAAPMIYPQEYIFDSLEKMENFILSDSGDKDKSKLRDYVLERFDIGVVAPQIMELFK